MTFPGSASPKLRFVAAAAAFATLYFVTAELTSSLAGDVGIAVLWPASGVYLGVMLVAPRHLWPALAVGAGLGSLAAYSHAGSSLELSVAFAVPSSAEGLLAAFLVERIVRGRLRLDGLHDVSALVAGAGIGTALVAVSAGAVASQTYAVSFAESWLRWWGADALGMLGVAPLVVVLAHSRGRRPQAAELRYAAAVLAVVVLAVSTKPSGAAAMVAGALALPALLWAGWRWGPRAAALGGTGLTLAAMNLASSSDLLGVQATDAGVHVLQAFLAALLISSLSFAAAVADWRRERVAAAQSSGRLRTITDSSPDAYVTVDSGGTITGWSARAQAMFDIDADAAVGRSIESIAPGAAPITPTPDARELTLLARRGSGREFPAALTVRPGIDGDDGLWHVFIRDLTESERIGKELGRATEEMRRRAAARDEARTELRGTARELTRANSRIDELTAALERRDDELAETKRALNAEQRDLERLMKTHARATAERDEARRDLAATAAERDDTRRDLAAIAAERDDARRELATTASERDDALRDRATIAADRDDARRDLAATAADRDDARRELAAAGAEREASRRDLERGVRETERLRVELAGASGELSRAQAELGDVASELAQAREGNTALRRELAEARAAGSALEQERARIGEELRAARAAQDANEAEWALLDEHSEEMIARYDERGVCLYVSPGSRGLLGFAPEELVGRPGADLIHPEDRTKLMRARAAGSFSSFQARLRRRSGDYADVEVTLQPDTGAGGLTTVARPVSRRADDGAGRIAVTRFASLFGTLPGPCALLGSDGRIVKANLALSRLTGYSRDQLEGTALGTLIDDESAPLVGGRLRQVASGQVATLRLEQRLARAGGGTVPVELSITPLPAGDANGDGRLHELVVHFEDVSGETRLTSAVA